MSEKKELANLHPGSLPAYLEDFSGDDGSSSMDQYVQPPYLKVVQPQSSELLEAGYSPGTVLLQPAGVTLLTNPGDTLHFTPIFGFTEYQLRAPLGHDPFLVDRSYDPMSVLGQRATDPDLTKRKIPHPSDPNVMCEAVDTINYIVAGLDGAAEGQVFLISFSKAEHRTGRSFVSLIKMRRGGKKLPMQSMVFAMVRPQKPRKNDKGSWYGIDIVNPTEHAPFIEDAEQFATFRGLYEQFSEDFKKGLLRSTAEDTNPVNTEVDYEAAAEASTGDEVGF